MIYDIKQFLKSFFNNRIGVLAVSFVIMFVIVLVRLFNLQIVEGGSYQDSFTNLVHKTITTPGTRGNIYDCNGNLLAYNELSYSLVISDNGSYASAKIKNQYLNAELAEILSVLHDHKEPIANNFGIIINEKGRYEYAVSGTSLQRFLADVFGVSSFSQLEYTAKLGFNPAEATPNQVMTYLMSDQRYSVSDAYDKQTAYEIAILRYTMAGNSYARYKTTTIADNVGPETIAYINEHSDTLPGASIEESTIRKYNDSVYFSSIIGYTGRINAEEYDTLSAENSDYTMNDMVGKIGLEQYYENTLRGSSGEKEIIVNNVGKITSEISTTDSAAGNDLYISIDRDLQIAVYRLLEQEIAGILYASIQGGSISMEDVFFALLDNNVVNLRHFNAEDASSNEQHIYENFLIAQQESKDVIRHNLQYGDKTLKEMSDMELDYFTYIIKLLRQNGILDGSRIDTSSDVYIKWHAQKLSPKDYLTECITQQWIDISNLDMTEKYPDTGRSYRALTEYIINAISDDPEFSKIIYRNMIDKGEISGKMICLAMMDQGGVEYTQDEYVMLESGMMGSKEYIMDKINNMVITPAQLALDPCTGSCVMTDPDTGEIKALVSYPGYDGNRLANTVDPVYYAQLRSDKSNPQWNYATQEKTAPGSTFKMVTSTAGLAEDLITTQTRITCTGVFEAVDNAPKCWVYPYTHDEVNVSDALRDSCNIFYYTLGYRLAYMDGNHLYSDATGIKYIRKYAELYGLGEKTGIEIGESAPEIADQYPVMAAIGQSNNNFTTVSLARYVTAVTSQNVYKYQLMNKIVNPQGQVIDQYQPDYTSIQDIMSQSEWDAVHYGMRQVCVYLDSFRGCKIAVAGKTGTAQQILSRPNHALFVGYAPYSNPDITIAVRIAYGSSSHNAASAARNILTYYFGQETLDKLLSSKAEGVNVSGNSRTD